MKEQILKVDISVLRCGHSKLVEEITVLRNQTSKLMEMLCALDSCWEPQATVGFENEGFSLSAKLNSLTDDMGTLAECMDFALKTYLGCEAAAVDSVSAANL